jgi:putative transposase
MPAYPQRRAMRLKDYAYSQSGAYFITICVEAKLHLFGSIHDQDMVLNDAGEMIGHWWAKIPEKFPGIELDLSVVMPNHMHGILCIADDANKDSISDVIAWFKTMTTNAYIRGVKIAQWRRFKGSLWQRTFHDNIIRNEQALKEIQEYILYNPAKWNEDRYYSEA